MMPLADPRRSTPGKCALCDEAATMWLRRTANCGLVVAARACDAHEYPVIERLHALRVADVVATIPRHRRAERAASATRRAARLRQRANAWSRQSAALQGASSATHTAALLAGSCEQEADALEEFARELLEGARSTEVIE